MSQRNECRLSLRERTFFRGAKDDNRRPQGATMQRIFRGALIGSVILMPVLRVEAQEKTIRLGMIGLDTSHVIAFTSYLNDPRNKTGCRVVAAFPGGSKDF